MMTHARDRSRTTRLVVRQVSELLLARWLRWQMLVPERRMTYVVFGTVLSASMAHHPLRDPVSGGLLGLAAARDRARPVNASAIALPMALPLTSARRYADELVDTGSLARGPAGYTVAANIYADQRFADVMAGDATDVVRVLRALAGAGFKPAARAIDRGVADLPDDVVSRLLLAFTLRSLETMMALYSHFTTGAIVTAIISANVRHITEDVALASRYAGEDALPPDAERWPIALRELARAIDIPFETVRRRVAALVADGVVVWKDAGMIVPSHILQSERYAENNRRTAQHFEQMIAGLVASTGELPG